MEGILIGVFIVFVVSWGLQLRAKYRNQKEALDLARRELVDRNSAVNQGLAHTLESVIQERFDVDHARVTFTMRLPNPSEYVLSQVHGDDPYLFIAEITFYVDGEYVLRSNTHNLMGRWEDLFEQIEERLHGVS